MTTFEEMDHKLGLHTTPLAACWMCQGEEAPPEQRVLEGGKVIFSETPPAFPDWGDVWVDTSNTLRVFVKDGTVPEKGASSRWVNITGKQWAPDHYDDNPITPPLYEDTQMEWGSGKWAEDVKQLAINKALPGEAALSSPLGVDLPRMAAQQNRALLVKEMLEQGLFPVCTSETLVEDVAVTRMTKVTESINVVRLPVL